MRSKHSINITGSNVGAVAIGDGAKAESGIAGSDSGTIKVRVEIAMSSPAWAAKQLRKLADSIESGVTRSRCRESV